VYASLFGIGKIVFGELGAGIVLLLIAVVAFAWIAKAFREEDAGVRAQRDVVAATGD
jgi:lipopolysaccharide export system protein LptC